MQIVISIFWSTFTQFFRIHWLFCIRIIRRHLKFWISFGISVLSISVQSHFLKIPVWRKPVYSAQAWMIRGLKIILLSHAVYKFWILFENMDRFEKHSNIIQLHLKFHWIMFTHVHVNDFSFQKSVFHKLRTVCLRHWSDATCEITVSVVCSCQSLQSVYVNEKVSEPYSEHPFVVAYKCK